MSIVSALADIFGVSEKTILSGDLELNLEEAGNMKRTKFYVCPSCASFFEGTGNPQIICCGKQIEALDAKALDEEHAVNISEIEGDYYIEFNHEMTKEHYVSFVAFATGDQIQLYKQFPEWALQVHIPKKKHGMLLWFDTRDGLFYQYI